MLSRYFEAFKSGLASLVVLVIFVGSQARAEAGQRWIAPAEVRNVLGNGNNYGAYNTTDQYLLWETGGKALNTALRAKTTGSAVEFKLTGKASGTNVPDGALNECVAFVRGATGAPGSGLWQQGAPVIFDSGVRNNITQGTLIATFVYDSAKRKWVYSGHCALFVGHRTDGGISVWDQNWGVKCVKWHGLNGTGDVNNPRKYFVVETN